MECLQADGLKRDVFLRAPTEWDPSRAQHIWKLRAPPFGLNDAPVAFRNTLRGYLLRTEELSAKAGRKFQISSVDPYLHFIFRGGGGAVRALTTQIDDVLDCGGPGVLLKMRK